MKLSLFLKILNRTFSELWLKSCFGPQSRAALGHDQQIAVQSLKWGHFQFIAAQKKPFCLWPPLCLLRAHSPCCYAVCINVCRSTVKTKRLWGFHQRFVRLADSICFVRCRDSPDWYEWAQYVLYTMNKPLYLVYQLVVVEGGFVDVRLQQEVIGGGGDLFWSWVGARLLMWIWSPRDSL